MKAPEKVYLYSNGHTLDNDWLYEAPEEFESFEYIRTDVFIEKACEWLKNNASDYAFVDTDRIGNVADIDLELIQDFKKYMNERL